MTLTVKLVVELQRDQGIILVVNSRRFYVWRWKLDGHWRVDRGVLRCARHCT